MMMMKHFVIFYGLFVRQGLWTLFGSRMC